MGMTIDESINWVNKNILEMRNQQLCLTDKYALNIAIDTMQKYQKIQEVMDSRPDDDAKSNSKALGEIEVIMYGNDD